MSSEFEEPMDQGTITKFNRLTVSGSITRKGDGAEIFFSQKKTIMEGFDSLDVGLLVEFEAEQGFRAPWAVYLRAV